PCTGPRRLLRPLRSAAYQRLADSSGRGWRGRGGGKTAIEVHGPVGHRAPREPLQHAPAAGSSHLPGPVWVGEQIVDAKGEVVGVSVGMHGRRVVGVGCELDPETRHLIINHGGYTAGGGG